MKHLSHFHSACLTLALALLAATTGFAQQPASETLQQQIGLPNRVDSVPKPPPMSSDFGKIGVVQSFPKPEMFSVSTSQSVFYTDNVFYTNANPVGSLAYLGSYSASYIPWSERDWIPKIGAQFNMVRYDRAASADFDNENLTLSSQYIFSDDRAWSWTATVNLARFTTPHVNDHEFYQEVGYDNQISHADKLIKNEPLYLIETYGLTYRQANPDVFDRLDNTVSLSLTYYPIPEISIGPFVRPSARIYMTNSPIQSERDDFNLSEGLDVTWTPWKYVAFSADIMRTDDFSSASNQSYAETSPGCSVMAIVKF